MEQRDMTPKQKIVFEFITLYIQMKGYAPSYKNIADAIGTKSKSNIHKYVHKLRKQGYLSVQPRATRSMKVVDASAKRIAKL
jgi:repressor LexA